MSPTLVSISSTAERARTKFRSVVSDQQLSLDQVHIRFDAAKSMGQRVQQWAGMMVVVVRMGRRQLDCVVRRSAICGTSLYIVRWCMP